MKEISFVTSNRNKYEEMTLLGKSHGIKVKWIKYPKFEIQANSLESIAEFSAIAAYSVFSTPLIVEDSGLFIDALKGFPGPYSAQAYKTIGLEGMIKLLSGSSDRSARFECVICYASPTGLRVFKGIMNGSIAKQISEGRKFGYAPIWVKRMTIIQ
jgi:XTP/dITP diphosphohydrolase